VLYGCLGHLITHTIGEALALFGIGLADPRDGRARQVNAETVGHQRGQLRLGQQLIVLSIQHERFDPRAILTAACASAYIKALQLLILNGQP
jgi:hypothetical protein